MARMHSQARFMAMMPPVPMPTTHTSTSMVSGSPGSGFSGATWKALTAWGFEPPASRASFRAWVMADFTALLEAVAPVTASTATDWFSMMRGNSRSFTLCRMTSVSPCWKRSSGTSIFKMERSFTVMVTGKSQVCQ